MPAWFQQGTVPRASESSICRTLPAARVVCPSRRKQNSAGCSVAWIPAVAVDGGSRRLLGDRGQHAEGILSGTNATRQPRSTRCCGHTARTSGCPTAACRTSCRAPNSCTGACRRLGPRGSSAPDLDSGFIGLVGRHGVSSVEGSSRKQAPRRPHNPAEAPQPQHRATNPVAFHRNEPNDDAEHQRDSGKIGYAANRKRQRRGGSCRRG